MARLLAKLTSAQNKERAAYYFAFIGALVVAMSIYGAHQAERKLRILNRAQPPGAAHYTVKLLALNEEERFIEAEIRRNERRSRREIVTYLHRGYSFETSSATTSSFDYERVTLRPENQENPAAESASGNEFIPYVARFRWPYATDVHSFPFDKIDLALAIETDPTFAPGDSTERAIPALYMVQSRIPDYTLRNEDRGWADPRLQPAYIMLERDGSVVLFALFVATIGFASAWLLIKKARHEKVELAALAYFGGLWAARGVVLTPLQGKVPFPTYVDLGVILLFCFTIFGVGISGLLKRRDEQAQAKTAG